MLQGNCSIKLIKLRLHLEPLLLRIPKIFFTVETPMGDLDEKYRFVIVKKKMNSRESNLMYMWRAMYAVRT